MTFYHIKHKEQKKKCDNKGHLKYNNPAEVSSGKEGDIVTEIIQKINKLEIHAHILRQLGLEKDWNKKVSTDFLCKVIKTAKKHKKVLKELSKY